MSFQNPAFRVLRRSVAGMEGMHSKMFDPPLASPGTPELMDPTNPVPEVMLAAGFLSRVTTPHTIQRQLMHGMVIPTWDGRPMTFFTFTDPDGLPVARAGSFPGATIRVPRGVIFHAASVGSGPPPHTIHWHGTEPTPMNDGVGHCSMEIGAYTYQFQPNFIGSYFHHCHRNTVQHFEFGLYGFTIVEPPDAYFASIASTNPDGTVVLNNVPVGNCRPEARFPRGIRRTAANLAAFPQFGQTAADRVPLTSRDPQGQFPTDPHAFTVHYHQEALWVLDDRDIRWSDLAQSPFASFPAEGATPGVDDDFHGNPSFFAFNDHRSTHFYVTGFNVPDDSGVARIPGAGTVPPNVVVPPALMSGVRGVQVSVDAQVGQNILIRVLNGAYNNARITFPVDIVIIAWDGRALGVPPFTKYNAPVLVPKGTPFEWSVARRFDALIKSTVPVNDFAKVEFIDTLRRNVRFTARIPIRIR